MSLNAQKYLVATLSLVLFGALAVVGRQETLLRSKTANDPDAPPAGPLSPDLDRGRQVYVKYSCNACHGRDAVGGIKNFNAQTGGMVNGLKMVGETYTEKELAKKILDGVPVVEKADPKEAKPPLTMPSYRGTIQDQEVEDLVKYLFSLQKGVKNPKKGDAW